MIIQLSGYKIHFKTLCWVFLNILISVLNNWLTQTLLVGRKTKHRKQNVKYIGGKVRKIAC